MKIKEMYVIYNREDRSYATRKSFTNDFFRCRIFTDRKHAVNTIKLRHDKISQNLCVIPIKVELDPRDEFAAALGGYQV